VNAGGGVGQQHQSHHGGGGGGGGGSSQNQKHDIFVGNLAFNTTEEQLHQVFSEIGRVVKVRMVTDAETGKPRGFAFVEFEDPQAALAAIRNMNEYELNGRNLRVNFSNSSHLETLANQLGMDMTQKSNNNNAGGGGGGKDGQGGHGGGKGGKSSSDGGAPSAASNTQAVADAIKALSKGEMWDIISQFKAVADKDPDEARKLLCVHPQLPEAILHLMSKMDMIQSPLPAVSGMLPGAGAPPPHMAMAMSMPAATVDPRLRAPPPPAPTVMDPRQQQQQQARLGVPPPPPPTDPRARAADPRMQQQQQAMQLQQQQQAPPPPPPPSSFPPPPTSTAAQLDPALVQQVMSLTPAQIAQLPPDKQQSILALRHQITGGR
jgi:cleavage stimulation factor subunit 2